MNFRLPILVLRISPLVGFAALATGCSAPADQPVEVSAASKSTPKSNCRLAVEATFDAENAQMTPMCEHLGGGSGASGGYGPGASSSGTPADPGSGDVGDNLAGYKACIDGCIADALDCSANPGKVLGCGFITITQAKLTHGSSTGVTLTKERVTLPPVPPEQAGTPGCVGKWDAGCHVDTGSCISTCSSQLD